MKMTRRSFLAGSAAIPVAMSFESMVLDSAEAVRPAKRMSVSEAAEEYRYINNPGSYVGP